MSVTREQFIAEARSWIGVPWLHQGRNRHGVDCIGLLLVTCWALGLTDYDVQGYGRTPQGPFMRNECDRLMTRTTDPQPGDVLLFRLSRELLHVMIQTAPQRVIHAWATPMKVVEVSFPAVWKPRVVAAYHVPGVA